MACSHPLGPMTSLTVRVPASTSNLGPGFDCLGLALSLWLEARWSPAPGGLEVHGGKGWPSASDDLLRRAFQTACERLDCPAEGRIEVESEIPIGRGFGSTGAAVAAGLLLAHARAGQPVARTELLPWGVTLEGHPDNVTASLFGGGTLCHPDARNGSPVFVPVAVHADVGVALAWPAQPLATPRARAALPETVPFLDAVENPRRLALLLEGLRRADPELLTLGAVDHLHVRHRLPLVPGASRGIEAAVSAGAWCATLSGAGSGLVALGPPERADAIAAAMAAPLVEATGGGSGRAVDVVRDAPDVRVQERA